MCRLHDVTVFFVIHILFSTSRHHHHLLPDLFRLSIHRLPGFKRQLRRPESTRREKLNTMDRTPRQQSELHYSNGIFHQQARISVPREEFDDPHKYSDEASKHLHRKFEVALESNDRATELSDGTLPRLLSSCHEENRTKNIVSDPFAIRKGHTLSLKNMSMTVVSV